MCGSANPKCFSATMQAVCRFQRVPPPPPSSLPPSTTQSFSVTPTSTGPKKQPHRQQKGIAAVFPTPTSSHTPTSTTGATTTPPVHTSMTDDQKAVLRHSTSHPTTVTASSASSTLTSSSFKSHQPSKMRQPFSALGPSLPQIYMHSSSSQPHSISGTGRGRGVLSQGGVRPKPVGHAGEMQQKVEVVANRPSPQYTVTTGPSTHTQSLTVTPQTTVAATVSSRTPLPAISPPVSTTSFTSRPRAPQTTSVSSLTPSSPRIIGTDSTRVRPSHTAFEALQHRHQHMVPTPIPMPTDLMSNPLKMAVSGSPLFGDFPITPPISSVPLPKKDGKTTTSQNKTNYNVPVNAPHNIALPGSDKGSVKMMQPPSLIQKQMPLLDMPVLVPPLVQNSGNSLTTLKQSSSVKDMGLSKSSSKMNQLNLVQGKGKESLDTIKITPGQVTSNISTDIMGPKSLSSALDLRSYNNEFTPSPAGSAGSGRADNAPQFPASAPTRSDSTESDSPLPVGRAPPPFHSSLSTSDSFSPSADDDCDTEGSASLMSTGPLVEYTSSYSGHPAPSSTGSDVDEESALYGWGDYENNCSDSGFGREGRLGETQAMESHANQHFSAKRSIRGGILTTPRVTHPSHPSSSRPVGKGRQTASVMSRKSPPKTSQSPPSSQNVMSRGKPPTQFPPSSPSRQIGGNSRNYSSETRQGSRGIRRAQGRGNHPSPRQSQTTFRAATSKPPAAGRQGTGSSGQK